MNDDFENKRNIILNRMKKKLTKRVVHKRETNEIKNPNAPITTTYAHV